MKKNIQYVFLFFIINLSSFHIIFSQSDFYSINKISKVEITFTESNWDFRLDTAKLGEDGYLMAKKVVINGTQFDSVGVKYKGNSSFDSTYEKNPIRITLDEFKSQNYGGYKDFKFANCFDDPSMIREILAYSILQKYMDAPLANFAEIYINGSYIGMYSNTETINKTFCSSRFGSSKNPFFDCTPTVIPSPQIKSNLKYISDDSSAYSKYYDMKSSYGWSYFIAMMKTITNLPDSIANVLDVDRALWMLAFNNALVNLDSYIGVFCQNYYLYRDASGRFLPIIWDLNMSFGGFPFLGSSNSSMGNIALVDIPNLTLFPHSNDQYWPLLKAIFNNPRYKKQYLAHLRTIFKENFDEDEYLSTANSLQTLIEQSVYNDKNKFFSDDNFKNGLDSDINVGTYTVPGIKNLIDARKLFLTGNTDFKFKGPAIEEVNSSVSVPKLNSLVNITARVSSANYVQLGYRFAKTQKFINMQMYDDGKHNDGTSNDGIYGAQFKMNDSNAHYFIYAENTDAGSFSPVRAEHEFYQLSTNPNSVDEESSEFQLEQNSPNPFETITNIKFTLKNPEHITFEIYNLLGEKVTTLFSGFASGGINQFEFSAKNLPPGIYYYLLSNGSEKQSKMMCVYR